MSAKKIEQEEFLAEVPAEVAGAAIVPASLLADTPNQAEGSDAGNGSKSKSGKTATTRTPFDPAQYLSNFDGREYLEVKWRLLWLRSEHPDARMTTEIVQHNEEGGFALFRAEVEIPGGGKATGWGSETVRDFHDYIEAAETKALGRALAALGYGTQFCQDFDFSANARPGTNQVVDAPVNLADRRNNGYAAKSNGTNGSSGNSSGSKGGGFINSGFRTAASNDGGRMPAEDDDFDRLPSAEISPSGSAATEKQIKAIYAIGRASKRLSEGQVDDRSVEIFGVRPHELTKAEASQLIDLLKGDTAA
ncbi:MAG: hypothetical protein M3437_20535 [Chloroflexota bacterium]|nr:hypothetical protein [Chloroflexota bacterium]MDQ5865020.1 hypothetical protein [Chloroflexota bacterium]